MKALLIAMVLVAGVAVAGPLDELLPRPKVAEARAGAWVEGVGAVRVGALTEADRAAVRERMGAAGDLAGVGDNVADAGGVPAGAYVLEVGAGVAEIRADGAEGARYARATLRQLAGLGRGVAPGCKIVDWPALRWRGMLHDTGRNFQPVGQLRGQLPVLADYKFNLFQWHITDNHGWRLESRKYPQLQAPENLDRSDGFYSQEDFKALIAYAHSLGITVLPEFDLPGHTRCFRRAFGLKRMDEPRVRQIVTDLLEEAAGLLDPKVTPFIHLGSDEVQGHERVPGEWLTGWVNLLEAKGFRVVAWGPGQNPPNLSRPLVRQYWQGRQVKRSGAEPYFDSQSGYYINHVDPLELLAPATYQQPCATGAAANRLGAIFAVWHDDFAEDPREVLTMNPVFPAIALYSDAFWSGRAADRMDLYGNLPDPRDPAFAQAAELERRVLAHRPLHAARPFPYWRQTDLRWRLAETAEDLPFAELPWGERVVAQGTVFPQHFFYPQSNLTDGKAGCVWLGMVVTSDRAKTVSLYADFMNYSRSEGRKRDLPLVQGQWNAKGAKLFLNGREIPPPRWMQPGLTGQASVETPLVDEPWWVRPPLRVALRQGRNELLVKLPKKGWKWSATCFFPEPEGLTFAPPERPAP